MPASTAWSKGFGAMPASASAVAREHRVIKAEDIDAKEVGERPEVLVEPVEVLLDAALVFVQDYSGDARFPTCDGTGRCCPGEESSYGICFASWLALGADRLSCFSEEMFHTRATLL